MWNHRSLTLITPPAAEPVLLADAKLHMRVDYTDDDALIPGLITAARELVEQTVGRQLVTATWQVTLDHFPTLPNSQFQAGNPNAIVPQVNYQWPLNPAAWAIHLPNGPVQQVLSVQYYDDTNTLQTMPSNEYQCDSLSEPARLTPVSGGFWPEALWQPDAVRVQYTSGYATVPQTLIQAIKMIVAHWYNHREAVITEPGIKPVDLPMGVDRLLWLNRSLNF